MGLTIVGDQRRDSGGVAGALRQYRRGSNGPPSPTLRPACPLLFETRSRGRSGSPSVAGSTCRFNSGRSSAAAFGGRFAALVASARRAVSKTRRGLQIFLPAIDPRAGEPGDSGDHCRPTQPRCEPRLPRASDGRAR